MAYKRKRSYRKPFVRRQKRRRTRRGRNRRGAKMLRCPTSFPAKMRCKLTFADQASTPYVIAAASPQVWNIIMGHRPLDIPDGTLSAVNPQGWDQWRNVYLAYRVLGMSVQLSFRSSVDSTSNTSIACYWTKDASPIGSALGIINNRFTHFKTLGKDDSFEYKTFARPWTILNKSKREYMTDSTFLTSTDLNPTNAVNLFIHLRNSSTANQTLSWHIKGNLYVEFSEPRTLVDT